MKAILYDAPGGPEVLYLGTAPTPAAGAGTVRVRVHATALNRADTYQRRGRYDPPPGASPLLGLEMAGEIETLGDGVDGWAVGDRVMALLPGGGYAEYVTVPADVLMPIPAGLSFAEAAAIPEVFLTAYQALHWLGEMKAGETVLIHAGASGVGTAAIQLARHAGAQVLVTASAGKHDRCLALGAARAIDYKREDFAERTMAATEGRGADVILDFLGASYLTKNTEALALDGRVVLLALMGGVKVEGFDLRPFFRKRARLQATTLRSRSLDYKARLTHDVARLLPLFANGTLRSVIDRVMPWTEAAAAHRAMEANENTGKIILQVR